MMMCGPASNRTRVPMASNILIVLLNRGDRWSPDRRRLGPHLFATFSFLIDAVLRQRDGVTRQCCFTAAALKRSLTPPVLHARLAKAADRAAAKSHVAPSTRADGSAGTGVGRRPPHATSPRC